MRGRRGQHRQLQGQRGCCTGSRTPTSIGADAFLAMLIDATHPPLEDAVIALNRVRVDQPLGLANILAA